MKKSCYTCENWRVAVDPKYPMSSIGFCNAPELNFEWPDDNEKSHNRTQIYFNSGCEYYKPEKEIFDDKAALFVEVRCSMCNKKEVFEIPHKGGIYTENKYRCLKCKSACFVTKKPHNRTTGENHE